MAAYTTIDNPELHFQVKLYTGTGSSHAITLDGSEDMAPDLVWGKNRDAADNHTLFDSVRGVRQYLGSNINSAEATGADSLNSFDSDGFTVGAWGDANGNTEDYAAWCWKAGTTSGITTTGADITPSAYSFNHTSRFSIAAYTGNGSSGAKIAHGLGAIPEMMIIQTRDVAGRVKPVYHHKNTSAPETDYLGFNNSDATTDGAWTWNDAVPTSVFMETQANTATNKSSSTYVLYSFKGVQGYSKFGGYTGNGNVNGTFVYTGFKPSFIMVKQTSGSANWIITDNKRDPYNVASKELYPNNGNVEGTDTDYYVDFLSNGLKWRGPGAATNSAATYVYAAFAANPFVNSNGVPCNAR